jgi:hypothetical protein
MAEADGPLVPSLLNGVNCGRVEDKWKRRPKDPRSW